MRNKLETIVTGFDHAMDIAQKKVMPNCDEDQAIQTIRSLTQKRLMLAQIVYHDLTKINPLRVLDVFEDSKRLPFTSKAKQDLSKRMFVESLWVLKTGKTGSELALLQGHEVSPCLTAKESKRLTELCPSDSLFGFDFRRHTQKKD